jgi:hypothetical protein
MGAAAASAQESAAQAAASIAAADAPAWHDLYGAYGSMTAAAVGLVVATGTVVNFVSARLAALSHQVASAEAAIKRLKDEDFAALKSELAKDILRVQGDIGGVRGDIRDVSSDKASKADVAASDKVVAAIKDTVSAMLAGVPDKTKLAAFEALGYGGAAPSRPQAGGQEAGAQAAASALEVASAAAAACAPAASSAPVAASAPAAASAPPVASTG